MSREELRAPIAGWLVNLRDVPDPVFSEEMMGVGVAIDPTEGRLIAPCAAKVLMVAPTQHSVTLKTEQGAEILIHIGLETVALEGRGFHAHVSDGEVVAAGATLISFDLDLVGLEAKSLVTPIVLANTDEFRLTAEGLDRLVGQADPIAFVERVGVETSAPTEGQTRSQEAIVAFEHGLHARPAARVADCAKAYSSKITISLDGKTANARSPTAIMTLNAVKSDRVQLAANGADADEALDAIAQLLSSSEETQHSPVASGQTRPLRENEISGVTALPGVAIGTAFHWRRVAGDPSEQGRGAEVERAALEEARGVVRAQLQVMGTETSGPAAAIARAHIGLLEDEELNAAAMAEIERGKSAARAWQIATSAVEDSLRSTDNPLLQERIADFQDIAAQMTSALLGGSAPAAADLPDATVIIADELLPSELLLLPRDKVVGLATARGGPTSHMAIIAASFGIPTMVAMGPELSQVPEGARLLLDATTAVLVVEPDQRTTARALEQAAQMRSEGGECLTRDGERVLLLANLGSLTEVEAALAAGAEGCGLLRTEFLFLDRAEAPSTEEQRSAYQAMTDALGGRPLTIRTLDIGGDKPVPYIRFPHEQNPALGARGIRTELFEPELLDMQLRAIAEVRGEQVKVMVPMVSTIGELRAVRHRLSKLREDTKLGVMVETPAAALIAESLAAEADFLSIGSNDLAQYTLAMDRTNPLLAASIDALHPAVLRLIAMTAAAGQGANKTVSLCGNLASEPLGALVLVGLGIRELSAVAAALPAVRHAIGQVSASDCRLLAERALKLESAAEVRALAADLLAGPVEGEAR